MTASTHIHSLMVDDLPQVTTIHFAAFPASALTGLGREAVRRYYEWQMIGPHDAVNVGAFIDEQIVGFCFGGVFHGAMGGFLRENRAFLAARVLTHPWLVASPLFRDRLRGAVSILSRRGEMGTAKSQQSTQSSLLGRHFGILAIAVMPQYQGRGIAQQLMLYEERIALERGFVHMRLTVHSNNARAVRFYEKMGWERVQNDGVWTGSMTKTILL